MLDHKHVVMKLFFPCKYIRVTAHEYRQFREDLSRKICQGGVATWVNGFGGKGILGTVVS